MYNIYIYIYFFAACGVSVLVHHPGLRRRADVDESAQYHLYFLSIPSLYPLYTLSWIGHR